jgi:hypothetical protein
MRSAWKSGELRRSRSAEESSPQQLWRSRLTHRESAARIGAVIPGRTSRQSPPASPRSPACHQPGRNHRRSVGGFPQSRRGLLRCLVCRLHRLLNSARPIHALDPVLHARHIYRHPPVRPRPIAQRSEAAALLVDLPLDPAHPQLIGQPERVPPIVLRPAALPHRCHGHLLGMRRQHLVQPLRQRPLLQADVARLRDALPL